MTDLTPLPSSRPALGQRLYRVVYNLKIWQVIVILFAASAVLYIW